MPHRRGSGTTHKDEHEEEQDTDAERSKDDDKLDKLGQHEDASGADDSFTAATTTQSTMQTSGGVVQMFTFEMLLLGHLLVNILVQNYNLYISNFYKYNIPLIAFTALFLTKRLAWHMIRGAWMSAVTHRRASVGLLVRGAFLVLPLTSLLRFTRELFLQYDARTFMYLFLPLVLYLSLFGIWDRNPRTLLRPANQYHPETYLFDFTKTVRKIMYSSLEAAYYAAFLPWRFLKDNHSYFNIRLCIAVFVIVLGSTFVLLSVNFYLSNFKEMFNRAQRIGSWQLHKRSSGATSWHKNSGATPWSKSLLWPRGALVRHKKKVYTSLGVTNYAEPGDERAAAFFFLFKNPHWVLSGLVLLQGLLIVITTICLACVRQWHAIAMWSVLVTTNYFVLFYALKVRRHIVMYIVAAKRPRL